MSRFILTASSSHSDQDRPGSPLNPHAFPFVSCPACIHSHLNGFGSKYQHKLLHILWSLLHFSMTAIIILVTLLVETDRSTCYLVPDCWVFPVLQCYITITLYFPHGTTNHSEKEEKEILPCVPYSFVCMEQGSTRVLVPLLPLPWPHVIAQCCSLVDYDLFLPTPTSTCKFDYLTIKQVSEHHPFACA